MQKEILPILTKIFPNIQFIITTHSPFILSSLDNAVIYDLENKTLVENGLRNLPYEGLWRDILKLIHYQKNYEKNLKDIRSWF